MVKKGFCVNEGVSLAWVFEGHFLGIPNLWFLNDFKNGKIKILIKSIIEKLFPCIPFLRGLISILVL